MSEPEQALLVFTLGPGQLQRAPVLGPEQVRQVEQVWWAPELEQALLASTLEPEQIYKAVVLGS